MLPHIELQFKKTCATVKSGNMLQIFVENNLLVPLNIQIEILIGFMTDTSYLFLILIE